MVVGHVLLLLGMVYVDMQAKHAFPHKSVSAQ